MSASAETIAQTTEVADGAAEHPATVEAAESEGWAVDATGVRRIFNGRAVLDGVDLQLKKGDFVAILGPSGTGKTTLLRIIGGLDTADEGHVVVPRVRSVVFQEPRLVPAAKVWKNVVLGARRPRAARKKAINALAEVGIEGHAKAWPRTLSGGEAQRVALARALVTQPDLLLLDEPFAALDALTRIKMHDLVGELVRVHNPAVVLVTHDVDEAILLSARILVLADGHIDTDITVDLEEPRRRSDPAFQELRQLLLDKLGVGRAARAEEIEKVAAVATAVVTGEDVVEAPADH